MSKTDATVLKDGQLAIATFEQSGTLISGASAIDTTCLVQTEGGVQQCVKTFPLGGGGGGGTSDYSDLSNKPQINGTTLSGNKSSSDLGVADTSLSNLTDAGKIKSAHLAMPSNTYTDLTYTAPSQTFQAPADGYFFFNVDAITYDGVLHLSVYQPDASAEDKQKTFQAYYGCCDSRPHANSEAKQTVPVLKGQYCTIKCTNPSPSPKYVCRFIYAQGSESEKQGA